MSSSATTVSAVKTASDALMPETGVKSDHRQKLMQVQQHEREYVQAAKKLKPSPAEAEAAAKIYQKRKVAMLLVYSGKGYLGMQRNPGFRTIESELLEALVKASAVRPDHIEQPGVKMAFQRAARTDKGVSAAGQVVSLKMLLGKENIVHEINCHLPEQIRVLGIKRATKGFDSKNMCDSRTYSYIAPTFAFASEQSATEDYRISDKVHQQLCEFLSLFKGTHNFHNFTSGKKPDDPSAKRYIMEFSVGEPFERQGLEFVVVTVRGQSFMLHQIRKMIGLTIAILQGFAKRELIEKSWQNEKVDIPKAPGLGLVLDRLHYDAYNKKFGHDGVHEMIAWEEYKDQIECFKDNYIYQDIYTTEREAKSMLRWLETLPLHHYCLEGSNLNNMSLLLEETPRLTQPFAANVPVHHEDSPSSVTRSNISPAGTTE